MSAALLAVSVPPLVAELSLVMAAAAIISYAFGRLGLVPLVGFVIAGVVVGPNALGVVSDVDLVEQTAEIGVIFLLFGIGLELSLDHLRKLGALMMGGGIVQVVLTAALVTGACLAFGVDANAAVYTGCLVSLSSTAIVLKLLSNRRETSSPVGEVAVAFLIFQDLAVVLMVLFVPMLGSDGGTVEEILVAVGTSVLVIGFVLAASRWLIPRVLDAVAQRAPDEVFLLTLAALALMIAYVSSLLGLTDSLGAFIAGLVISSGRHRERALRYTAPFQTLFSAIFFASIGMLLDPAFLLDRWSLVLVLAVGTIVTKVVATAAAAKAFGRSAAVAVTSAFLLAQLGEFAFVLEQTGRAAGLSPAGTGESGSQAFIATAVLLFILTPLLDTAGRRAGTAIAARRPGQDGPPTAVAPVVVLGGDRAAIELMASSLRAAGRDEPVVDGSASGDEGAVVDGAALVVAIDLAEADLSRVVEAATGCTPPIRVLAWIVEPGQADRFAERDHVDVIDAGGATGISVALATLRAVGVDASMRGDALTSAVEHLPTDLRRPLA